MKLYAVDYLFIVPTLQRWNAAVDAPASSLFKRNTPDKNANETSTGLSILLCVFMI
jgi:hypothetical protein